LYSKFYKYLLATFDTKIVLFLKLKISHCLNFYFSFILVVVFSLNIKAQSDTLPVVDTISANISPDSSKVKAVKKDTSKVVVTKSKNALDSKVDYTSNDSIMFDITNKKVFLYGNADIKYENITIKANYIEISFEDNLLFASGVPDSSGKISGKPAFSEGDKSFQSDTMTYNFKTKKGIIKQVITEEGEGYLHGKKIKRMADEKINLIDGKYTTCSLEHPHFYIGFKKAKVIPNDKIVTGPVYLFIEDVPLPLVLPFGLFPNKKGQQSGILIPTYGESANRGFFLENGGYYFGINENVDLALRGTIYTRGSWALKALSNYNKRYKYIGSFDLNYAVNIDGEKDLPGYSRGRDFFIRWNHTQDAKARPNSRFTANVNAGSSNYQKYNPSTSNDYLSNTFQSNIAYQTTLFDKFNFSANVRHSQNTLNKTVDLSLPEITLSANRFYPFRKENRTGNQKWYENINIGYNMSAQNSLTIADSLFFTQKSLRSFRNGMKQSIPISSSIKVLKYFSLNNSINYNELWYLSTIDRSWSNDQNPLSSSYGYVETDTIPGYKTARDFSFSSSLNTKLYGMFQFKRGPVKALRHVITPFVGFTYHPEFGLYEWGYYKYYLSQSVAKPIRYSIFETGVYGSPSPYKSENINWNIANNLEMKIKAKSDTSEEFKKIVLIDNFTISGAYDVAKDTLKFSKILLSGRTVLLKNLDVRYAAALDPYITDSTGRNLNTLEWEKNKRLVRLSNSEWSFGLNWNYSSKGKTPATPATGTKTPAVATTDQTVRGTQQEKDMINKNPEAYVDFKIPWSINLAYTLRYTNTFTYLTFTPVSKKQYIQTLSFYGDVNLTPKWKIGFRSGYDFEMKDISYTSVDIYRDLHCWEIKFNWVPTGYRKSWNVTINVKAAVLQDLKLTKKKDWRDAYY